MSTNSETPAETTQTPAETPPTQTPAETAERDAIIYVPGLFADPASQSVDVVAWRMIYALNRQAKSGSASFILSKGEDEDYGGNKTRTITISRKDGARETPIIDLYGLDYSEVLLGQYTKKKPFMQALLVAWLLLSNVGRIIGAARAKSKSFSQKAQVVYAGFLFVLLSIYMIILFSMAVISTADAVRTVVNRTTAGAAQQSANRNNNAAATTNQTSPSSATPRGKITPWWLYLSQVSVLILTALGVFTSANVKQILSRVSGELTCAMRYLAMGARGGALAGQFSLLLDYIEEKQARSKVEYRKINVVAFSFGTVITLDAIFPPSTPSVRTQKIKTLVTIGCPFDFVRTYWKDYFDDRLGWEGVPRKWINIYARADVLGSDFMDEKKDKKAPRGVKLEPKGIKLRKDGHRSPTDNVLFGKDVKLSQYSFLEKVSLIGFKTHVRYWEGGQLYDVNCFDDVIQGLYDANADGKDEGKNFDKFVLS